MQPCPPDHPEFVKMRSGDPYFTHDKALVNARAWAKSLCFRLQHAKDKNQVAKIQAQLLPHAREMGIGAHFYCDYGVNITADDNVRLGDNVVMLDGALIVLSANVVVGDNVVFAAVTHPVTASDRISGLQIANPITIGTNTILGNNVTILPGVNVIAGSRVPDNTVVTRSSVYSE